MGHDNTNNNFYVIFSTKFVRSTGFSWLSSQCKMDTYMAIYTIFYYNFIVFYYVFHHSVMNFDKLYCCLKKLTIPCDKQPTTTYKLSYKLQPLSCLMFLRSCFSSINFNAWGFVYLITIKVYIIILLHIF